MVETMVGFVTGRSSFQGFVGGFHPSKRPRGKVSGVSFRESRKPNNWNGHSLPVAPASKHITMSSAMNTSVWALTWSNQMKTGGVLFGFPSTSSWVWGKPTQTTQKKPNIAKHSQTQPPNKLHREIRSDLPLPSPLAFSGSKVTSTSSG